MRRGVGPAEEHLVEAQCLPEPGPDFLDDLGDAIEACSGHLIATHLHDNKGKTDDHLAPGEGAIDWPSTLMSLQKVGYDGTWLFEVANTSTPGEVLKRIEKVRHRFESLLTLSFEAGA